MAYNPSDLKLPSWLLKILNILILIRIPIGTHWHIGLTRSGTLMFFSLLGLWAAAFYSGNNLLYLCGGMLSAIAIMALWQGFSILRKQPKIGAFLPPYIEVNNNVVLHQNIPSRTHYSALIHISWPQIKLQLQARLSQNTSILMAQLRTHKRGITSLEHQHLKTSAPLGLWELEYKRSDHALWVSLPQAKPWQYAAINNNNSVNVQYVEGDEYHDLRAYMPGDMLSRIHWRKSTLEPASWRIKRFIQPHQPSNHHGLCVDLRLPATLSHTDFERLLAMAWYWLKSQPKHSQGTLTIGQQLFHLSDKGEYIAAIHAIASATPEAIPPINQVGIMLSLLEHQ